MISFKLSELAIYGNYKLQGNDAVINAVSTDSRNCKDALFVALKGEKFDGHDFIEKAVDNGAIAVVSSKELPDNITSKVSVILCNDTLKALGYCGYLVRRQCKAKVASLTGSCGKTTVKEFTQAILSECGNSMCTNGNFNNDVGVPLTLMRLDNSLDFAVVEQGASHLFDNAHTCEFVKADTALINNVGGAHIEGFGSYDGVYRGKSQIIDDVLSHGGKAVVPSDSKYFERWSEEYKAAFRDGYLFSFGTHDFDLVQYSNVKDSLDGVSFTLRTPHTKFDIKMNVIGAHNASNAAAACALALITGADESKLETGLKKAQSLKGRLSVHNFKNFALIDDAYNASYNACLSAIDTLSLYQGHKVMIFGDMGELGEAKVELHQDVGAHCVGKVDELLCVGELSKYSCDKAHNIAKHFNCHSDLVQYARNLLKQYPFVSFLVKGSHAMHMDDISKELLALGELK